MVIFTPEEGSGQMTTKQKLDPAQRAVDYLVAASEAGMKKETIREAA